MRIRLLALTLLMACGPGDRQERPSRPGDDPTPDSDDPLEQPDPGPGADTDVDTDEAPTEVPGDTGMVECVDPADYLQTTLWPQLVGTTCIACHSNEGLAKTSNLVLQRTAVPGAMDHNLDVLTQMALKEQDGESWLLLKPQNLVPHGGGAILSSGDAGVQLLQSFITAVANSTACEDESPGVDPGENPGVDPGEDPSEDTGAVDTGMEEPEGLGLTLMSPVSTLRKATLVLAGRLPTAQEEAQVRAGGESALVYTLWQVMGDDDFADRMVVLLNDVFLTDRWFVRNEGIGILDINRYPSVLWWQDVETDDLSRYFVLTNEAITREPLMLARHILREDRPWTEILTADYMMANTWLELAYGVYEGDIPLPDDPAANEWHEMDLEDYPHAGVLTTVSFLNRYPTTSTNRNRHRSWFFYKTFLDTDIMTFANRPVDTTGTQVANPTLNDPNCTVCHTTMDPVAGLFQNWNLEGAYRPPADGWYDDMLAPGFGGVDIPDTELEEALPWLGAQAVLDPRFDVASVKMVLKLLTGVEPLTADTAGDDPVLLAALLEQDAWISDVATEFRSRGHDLKWVVEQVVVSHWFRAIEDDGAAESLKQRTGAARFLSPEELHDKIEATVGMPWIRPADGASYLKKVYNLMYGGIDSHLITERLREPSSVMESVATLMANDMACKVVPRDFMLPTTQRTLFPHVEMDQAPIKADGTADTVAEVDIRRNLQWLFLRLLGEDLTTTDPEIDAAYDLLSDAWVQGRDDIDDGTVTSNLPWDCQVREDVWTGATLPSDQMVKADDDHAMRAWMTVVIYLLTDYRFLHE